MVREENYLCKKVTTWDTLCGKDREWMDRETYVLTTKIL